MFFFFFVFLIIFIYKRKMVSKMMCSVVLSTFIMFWFLHSGSTGPVPIGNEIKSQMPKNL